MSVQFLDSLNPSLTSPFEGIDGPGAFGSPSAGSTLALPGLDAIASQYPENPMFSSASMALGPMGGLLQYLGSMISQFFGGGSSAGIGAGGGQQYFASATGGSNGDPHLSFDGSTWNDMNAQPNLLDSNSFRGGYQVSTQTTTPNASGITYNQSATVSSDYGNESVTLDNAGNATVQRGGCSFALQDGTTMNLGNGESVTRSDSGAVTVTSTNREGGSIATTLSDNGSGVNVNVSAQNVDLGGSLVNGANGTVFPEPPHYIRYSS